MNTVAYEAKQRDERRSMRRPCTTRETRDKIRRLKAEEGLQIAVLAERFGLSRHAISRICRGEW